MKPVSIKNLPVRTIIISLNEIYLSNILLNKLNSLPPSQDKSTTLYLYPSELIFFCNKEANVCLSSTAYPLK